MLNCKATRKYAAKKQQYRSKRNFTHVAHFFYKFLCRCFAELQKETSTSFLVTYFIEEMS